MRFDLTSQENKTSISDRKENKSPISYLRSLSATFPYKYSFVEMILSLVVGIYQQSVYVKNWLFNATSGGGAGE